MDDVLSIRTAMIAWNCDSDQIEVRYFGPPNYGQWADRPIYYEMTWGACFADFSDASDQQLKEWVVSKFSYVTCIDGVDPKAAHREFMKLKEYRQMWAKQYDPEHEDNYET